MSEQRRPTVRLGKKRDPRVDSVPPSQRAKDSRRDAEADSSREIARERAEAGGDIDELLGRLLARATQAEVRAQHLEQTIARMNEERVVVEARLADLVRQLDDVDTHRASLEARLKTMGQSRRTDGPITMAYVRTMAAELVRALDRVGYRATPSDLPTPRPQSDLPTPRPRTDRPRR